MDGRKPMLRNLLIAALALAGQAAELRADDFIRQPSLARTQSAESTRQNSTGSVSTPEPASQLTSPASPSSASPSSVQVKVRLASSPSTVAQHPRSDLAAAISSELTAGHWPVARTNVRVAASLEPGPGWQAVGQELSEHVSNCERLLSRSAYLSAMEEAKRGIVRLVRVIDLRQNKLTSEPAWAQAQQALREALEFTTHERIANDTELFTRVIQSHETPALHGADVSDLTPLAAAQHYRAYAEKCLVEASQGHPWFGELYYCMGRALEAQAEGGNPQADALLQEALTYFRSARTIQPSNATNTNQLAYVLLRVDRPSEALAYLAEAVRQPACPLEAWQNMIEASSRVSDRRTEQWALQNYTALKQRGVTPASQSGTLVEVDPRQFAALSPYTSGPQVQAQSVPQTGGPAPSPSTAPASTTRTAAQPRAGLFR